MTRITLMNKLLSNVQNAVLIPATICRNSYLKIPLSRDFYGVHLKGCLFCQKCYIKEMRLDLSVGASPYKYPPERAYLDLGLNNPTYRH